MHVSDADISIASSASYNAGHLATSLEELACSANPLLSHTAELYLPKAGQLWKNLSMLYLILQYPDDPTGDQKPFDPCVVRRSWESSDLTEIDRSNAQEVAKNADLLVGSLRELSNSDSLLISETASIYLEDAVPLSRSLARLATTVGMELDISSGVLQHKAAHRCNTVTV